jgi:ThiF family
VTVTLVIPHSVAEELEAVARFPNETAGVMQVSVVEYDNFDARVLVRKMRWIPESAYVRRERNGLVIPSVGYVPFLGEAESAGAACIWVHTHPGSDACPKPSARDLHVDEELEPLFQLRTGSEYYGALIVSALPEGLAFTGHLARDGFDERPINRMWQIGDRFRLTREFGSPAPQLTPAYDRNVRAFGSAIQRTLGDLAVGIIGCGGTGSIVAEQLVRLGVRRLRLVDPDRMSDSNLTRVFGSTASDVGMPKVEVLRRHLSNIAPDVQCAVHQSTVNVESTARSLVDSDIVFGCTDDNAGRLVLSRLSSFLLTPVVDIGVLLSSDEAEHLTGIDCRVTVLTPGAACLVCRGRIDLRRAATELLTPEERMRRQDEGYAPALGRIEPAVVSFTTMVGASAVGELLERLVGFGAIPRPSEILLRCHDREISTNVALPVPGHYCDPAKGKLGLGCADPFLEQTWLA